MLNHSRLQHIFFALALAAIAAGGCVYEVQDCAAGTECDLNCSGGDCALFCEEDARCDADCSGGDCMLTCERGATCDLNCSGGDCLLRCHAEADCDMNCSGGDCRMDTYGERRTNPTELPDTCASLCDAVAISGEASAGCVRSALASKGFVPDESDPCGALGDADLCGGCFSALELDRNTCAIVGNACTLD